MLPFLLCADNSGNIYVHPSLRMTALGMSRPVVPGKEELTVLPRGSTFFYFPHRYPVGFDPVSGRTETVTRINGKKAHAVAAFLVPGYLRLYNPSYTAETQEVLPLWAYTACGFYGGRWRVAAAKVDPRVRQSPRFYDDRKVAQGVARARRQFPRNRLYAHLSHCALQYGCLAAKNLFLNRWEAPLPVSRSCNARCLGCISLQESECCASHQRIQFRPEVGEILEVMVPHLKTAPEAMVSFGQGCEGDPLMEAPLIAESAEKVRAVTARGTIHVNTNASIPAQVRTLCGSGVDSFRVSLFSAREKSYRAYFRPRGYGLRQVKQSIAVMKRHGKFVSLNLLVFPGFTDRDDETAALMRFVDETGVDMVQLRNLNIDPLYFSRKISVRPSEERGIAVLVKELHRRFPALKTGYFNLPREKFSSF